MSEPRDYEIINFKCTANKADGSPMLTKTGKPMWRVDVQIAERPGVWINGLVFNDPGNWKDTKQKLILTTEEYQGRQIPKFKLFVPKGAGGFQAAKFDEMIVLLRSIDASLKKLVEAKDAAS